MEGKKVNLEAGHLTMEELEQLKQIMEEEKIKKIFEEEAEKRRWYDKKLACFLFDRDEVVRAIYDYIEYSKYFSIMEEEKRKLIETLNKLTDEDFERWQDELYEKWRITEEV